MTLLVCTGIENSGWEACVTPLIKSGLVHLNASEAGLTLVQALNSLPTDAAFDADASLKIDGAFQALARSAASQAGKPGVYHHARLLEVLEHLPTVESDIQYLLFYGSPAQSLNALIESGGFDATSVDQQLTRWRGYLGSMLDFFQANRKQCLLININDARRAPAKLISTAADALGTVLDSTMGKACEGDLKSNLVDHVAQALTAGKSAAEELYLNAKLQSTLLSGLADLNAYEASLLAERPASMWRFFNEEVPGLRERLHQLAKSVKSRDARISELDQQRSELEAGAAQLESRGEALAKQCADLQSENEINSLQINQLQEELEYYFNEILRRDESRNPAPVAGPLSGTQNHYLAEIESYTLSNARDFDGETHLDARLEKLQLSDSRVLDSLHVKLICGGGRVGLEFRPETDDDALLNWSATSADEFGPYFSLIIQAVAHADPDANLEINQLSTTQRVLVTGVISALAAHISYLELQTSMPALSGRQTRDLLQGLSRLESWLERQKCYLSFDSISLAEEFRTDGYEHLWIKLSNVLQGESRHDSFDFKLAISGVLVEQPFAESIMLEFRELENGEPPMEVWPPDSKDEHGYYLQAQCTALDSPALLPLPPELSARDRSRLGQIMLRIPEFLAQLESQGEVVERPWPQWCCIARHLPSAAHPPEPEQAHEQGNEDEDGHTADANCASSLTFAEQYAHPGYAHLAFNWTNGPRELSVKLQAKDLDPGKMKALPAIEFRNTQGGKLPFSNTRCLHHDEHGEFVSLTPEVFKKGRGRPTLESHPDDYALLENVLYQLQEQLVGIEIQNSEQFPDRQFWQQICTQFSDSVAA